VLAFVAPYARAAARAATAGPRLVDVSYTARVGGMKVNDRCLWDLTAPAGAAAAHASSVAVDLRLGPRAAAPLEAALVAAIEAAREKGGKVAASGALDRGAAAGGWGPHAEPERGGWADA
jgi:hypothetical protein